MTLLLLPQRTIHDWANEIRQQTMAVYGEKFWSWVVVYFDQQLPPGNSGKRRFYLLQAMALSKEVKQLQLCIVWLDGAGYGSTRVAELLSEINSMREAQCQLIWANKQDYSSLYSNCPEMEQKGGEL